jgi:hypothetical protein
MSRLMTPRPDNQIDPTLAEAESLDNTDVQGQLKKDPEEQANRESAPDAEDLPGPGRAEAPG